MSKTRTLTLAATAFLCLTSTATVHAQQAIKVFASVNINDSLKNGPYSYGTNTDQYHLSVR